MTATRVESARNRQQTRVRETISSGVAGQSPARNCMHSAKGWRCDKPLGNSYPRSGCWRIPLWKVLKVLVYPTLPAGGRRALGAVTKLRHRRMLATLEGKQLRTSSWASYRVCEVAAVSTGNRSNLPHPGLWAPKHPL